MAEITAWPREGHHIGKITTGGAWRSRDDRINVEHEMVRRVEKPDDEDRIRMCWLGRQRWNAYALEDQSRRILAWFYSPKPEGLKRKYAKRRTK